MENASFTKVSARNLAKIESEKAFREKRYTDALKYYQVISDNSYFTPPEVVLNQAHSYLLTNDTLRAQTTYRRLIHLEDYKMASTTYCQLGVISCALKDSAQALVYLKEALKLNPQNQIARFNFELLKLKFRGSSNESKDEQQSTSAPPPPSSQNAEVDNTDAQDELLKTLKNYGLSPEKARMLLEAMKNKEVQYIQQKNGLLKKNKSNMKQSW
ncbi:tetratricopeptide repeat protein [Flectobacillus sp.]|uniref:tetratricopeptide repeat protein n=1 Tax=Flectobacillus sp. TaxID=50419 RepID=UPI003BAC8618